MISPPQSRSAIAALLPHAGSMVLLDRVTDLSAERIVCLASSHRALDNPLRDAGGLPAAAAVEYAAQAMALAGAGLDGAGAPRRGFVAVAANIRWSSNQLDEPGPRLRIEAERVAALGDGAQYQFLVGAEDDPRAITGMLTLALEAPGATVPGYTQR
jgi:predicted hotdog family 3-hydroxylacyl-ACP dehydratase